MKESFDIIGNSVGEKGSIYYDKDNNRKDTTQFQPRYFWDLIEISFVSRISNKCKRIIHF